MPPSAELSRDPQLRGQSPEPRQASAELFQDPAVSDRYLEHYLTLRGKVRQQIVRLHLEQVVLSAAGRSLEVIDIGCGDGRDAMWLAQLGHRVLAVDPSQTMVDRARSFLQEDEASSSLSLTFELGAAEDVFERCSEASFDLVLSHGVVMYQEDPQTFIAEQIKLLRPDGVLSLLAKNADGLVYRAAQEASVDEAIRVLDDSRGLGHLGVSTGAQTMQELSSIGFDTGATVRSWAGVRMFSDTPTDVLREADDERVIELEWRAALRDPYRKTASLLHVLMLKGVDLDLLPR
jgi:S-adenosylmethionine-dependent methyltransferase